MYGRWLGFVIESANNSATELSSYRGKGVGISTEMKNVSSSTMGVSNK